MVLIRLQKVEFESVLQFFALASFVFDETWCVQVTSCKVYEKVIAPSIRDTICIVHVVSHRTHSTVFQITFHRNTVET